MMYICWDDLFKLKIYMWWLSIAGNFIDAEGAKAIGEALKTNETLIDVNLSGEE